MKKTTLFLVAATLISFFARENIFAQDATEEPGSQELSIGQVTVINFGDGRLVFRDMDGYPLNGMHRIMDGVRSEYKMAGFTNGFYNGPYEHYKYNKLFEQGTYSDGRKSGEYREYYSDGQVVKKLANYTDGKLDGVVTTYYNNGMPEREKWYKMSVEDGPERKYDYPDGEMHTELNYVGGKLHGAQVKKITSNIGVYVETSNYNMGVPDGDYSEIYEDGLVRLKGRYENGVRIGNWEENRRYYDDKGRLKTEKVKR